MRKKRKRSTNSISLFPFLSVLVCLIGILMFIAIAVAPTSIETAKGNVKLEFTRNKENTKDFILLECTDDVAKNFYGDEVFYEEDTNLFNNYLENLIKKNKGHIVFLVRPDGIDIFKLLRNQILQFNYYNSDAVQYGSELIPENWNIKGANNKYNL